MLSVSNLPPAAVAILRIVLESQKTLFRQDDAKGGKLASFLRMKKG